MANPVSKINLNLNILFPQGTPQKLPIKFLKWLLSYGRFIALVVEAVVIVTFVARFKLDADLASLKDKINAQVPFIQSLSQDEAQIKQTQLKLTQIRTVYASEPNWQSILTEISNQLPAGVTLSVINLDHTQPVLAFRVNGQASSNSDLATFIAGLKQDQTFNNINLTNVTFDSGQLTFTITGEAK